MVNYSEAFKRPFSDWKNLLIGIVLGIIPIVNFMVLGYTLECVKTAMKGKFVLPKWEGFGKLFINGLQAVLITIIYLIPVFLIVAIFAQDMFLAGTDGLQYIDSAVPSLGMFFAALVFLLTMYVYPAALVRFSERYQFRDAFTLPVNLPKCFTAEYFKVWAVMMLYYTILLVVFSGLGFVGNGIVAFVGGVTMMTAFGEVWAQL